MVEASVYVYILNIGDQCSFSLICKDRDIHSNFLLAIGDWRLTTATSDFKSQLVVCEGRDTLSDFDGRVIVTSWGYMIHSATFP